MVILYLGESNADLARNGKNFGLNSLAYLPQGDEAIRTAAATKSL
jgi:hypothetical protein